jgi:hypothetical protein
VSIKEKKSEYEEEMCRKINKFHFVDFLVLPQSAVPHCLRFGYYEGTV